MTSHDSCCLGDLKWHLLPWWLHKIFAALRTWCWLPRWTDINLYCLPWKTLFPVTKDECGCPRHLAYEYFFFTHGANILLWCYTFLLLLEFLIKTLHYTLTLNIALMILPDTISVTPLLWFLYRLFCFYNLLWPKCHLMRYTGYL